MPIYAYRASFNALPARNLGSFSSSDGQRLAGFRVAALTFCAFANVESTETDQSYGVAFFRALVTALVVASRAFWAAALEMPAS